MGAKNQIVKFHKENSVVQSNAITSASYDWTLVEKKVFSIILNQIYQIENLARNENIETLPNEDLILTFDSKVLLRAVNHISTAYKVLRGLVGKVIEINKNKSWVAVSIFSYVEHHKDTHKIEVQISRKILPDVLKLTREFTQYSLSTMLSLRSTYSQRFYELCLQYESRGYFYFSIEQIRKIFDIKKNQYTTYSMFVKKIIEQSQNELRQSHKTGVSEVYFKWSPDSASMKGKKVTALNFSVINPNRIFGRNYADLLYQIRAELYEIFRSRRILDSVDWWLTYNSLDAEALLNRIVELKSVYEQSNNIESIIETMLINEFQIEL